MYRESVDSPMAAEFLARFFAPAAVPTLQNRAPGQPHLKSGGRIRCIEFSINSLFKLLILNTKYDRIQGCIILSQKSV